MTTSKGMRGAEGIVPQQNEVGKRNELRKRRAVRNLLKRKTPRRAGRFQIQTDSQTIVLRLGWRGGRCSGLGGRLLLRRRGATFHRVGRIVEADNVLSNVNLRGSVKNGSVLSRRVQDHGVAVLAGIAIEHVHHLAADAVDDFTLRRVQVFLKLVVQAIEALRGFLSLLGQTSNFVLAALAFAGSEALAQIVDLFVQVFQLSLTRSELGLEFGGSLFALGGISDGAANVDDANLTQRGRWSGGRRRRGRLSADRSDNQKTGSGEGSRVLHDSGIHFILLIHWYDSESWTTDRSQLNLKLLTAPLAAKSRPFQT